MHDSVDRLQCFNCLYEVSFSAAWRISLLHVLRYIPELSLNCSSRPLSHYRSVESLKIKNRKYLYRLKYSLQENYFCCMLDAVVQFGELRVAPSLGLQRVFFFVFFKAFLLLFFMYLFIFFTGDFCRPGRCSKASFERGSTSRTRRPGRLASAAPSTRATTLRNWWRGASWTSQTRTKCTASSPRAQRKVSHTPKHTSTALNR